MIEHGLNLVGLYVPAWVWIALISHLVILLSVAYLILLERKVASWAQDRIGPNRVGLGFGIIPWLKDKHMFGLGQPLADGVKFILKEDYQPAGVDKYLFTLAPCMMIIVIIMSIAVLPWGGVKQTTREVDISQPVARGEMTEQQAIKYNVPVGDELIDSKIVTGNMIIDGALQKKAVITYRWTFQAATLNIGVLYVLSILSLAVYGVVIGGYASNNKYSFLGGLRATANMISYEIPLGLAVICVVVLFGTLNMETLVEQQCHYYLGFIPAWNIVTQPIAFILFLICIHAEANRAPFDMAEAEQELVGGYHTEYSAMRFALFFLAEYAGMITTSAVCVALFFGGWHLPWIEWAWPALAGNVDPNHPALTTSMIACIVRGLIFFGKVIFIIFVFMWVRWSLPRFRFDQLMTIAWRALIPISLATLVLTTLVVYFWGAQPRPEMRIPGWMALWLFLGNIGLMIVTMIVSKIIPAAPPTNRRIEIPGSRFNPAPAGVQTAR